MIPDRSLELFHPLAEGAVLTLYGEISAATSSPFCQ